VAATRAPFFQNWTIIMQIPSWTKPALTGAAGGAVVLAIAGFSWGGWVTGGTAQDMAEDAARDASTAIVASLCVNKFAAGPNATAQLAKLKETKSWNQDDFIEDGGWASIPGIEDGMRGLANACAKQLVAMDELPMPAMAPAVEISADNG
jgi:hypothetical protein